MVRPNMNKIKPYHHLFDTYHWDRPPVPTQGVERPDRPETPIPAMVSPLRFFTIRRHRMPRINRGLIHVHKNGLRTRMPTCPINATCVGIDDIGEYMYNQAKKCKHLMEEANRMRDVELPPPTEQTPKDLLVAEKSEEKTIAEVEMASPPSGVVTQNFYDLPASSEYP